MDSIQIGITFLQKQSRNTGKDQCTYGIQFLDFAFAEMKPRSVKERGHIMYNACSSLSMIKIG